jgi:NADH:ubiquinone oxidoreductase subunit
MKGFIEQVKTGVKIFFRCAAKMGVDRYGNRYFESRNLFTGTPKKLKRWVLYKGIVEGSKVPAAWHAWLHFYGDVPRPGKQRDFFLPNMTGAPLNRGRKKSAKSPHYIPWKP